MWDHECEFVQEWGMTRLFLRPLISGYTAIPIFTQTHVVMQTRTRRMEGLYLRLTRKCAGSYSLGVEGPFFNVRLQVWEKGGNGRSEDRTWPHLRTSSHVASTWSWAPWWLGFWLRAFSSPFASCQQTEMTFIWPSYDLHMTFITTGFQDLQTTSPGLVHVKVPYADPSGKLLKPSQGSALQPSGPDMNS